jgi:phospholipid/cholesterol/gamma-HCH transport system substrate-binding protein
VKISNETKVGLFAVFSLALLILGYNFLRGKNIFHSPNYFYAYYENINGLVVSNPVNLYGYKVGKVEKVQLVKYKTKNILVKFSVSDDILIPSDSRAKILSTDLFGAKAIEIILGSEKRNANDNDTLLGETDLGLMESVNGILNPIKQKVTSLLTTFDNVMNDLQTFLSKGGKRSLQETVENLKKTFANLENTTATLDGFMTKETKRISGIIAHIDNIANTLDDNKDEINNFISNLSNLSDTLKAAQLGYLIKSLNKTVTEIDGIAIKINQGKGSIGMLVNNDSLYNNLAATSKSLDELIIDLKANPKRYVNISVISIGGGKKKKK